MIFFGMNSFCYSGDDNKFDCNYSSIQSEELSFRNSLKGDNYFYGWTKSPTVSDDNVLLISDYNGKNVKIITNDELIADESSMSNHFFRKAFLEDCTIVYARYYADGTENFNGAFTKAELKEKSDAEKNELRFLAKLKSYIGKSFWINTKNYPQREIYSASGESIYELKKFEKFTVKDILTENPNGNLPDAKFYLVVITESNMTGLIPYNESYILKQSPISSKRPVKIYNAIKQEKIILGMTLNDVKLSWGEPDDINRSVGSWGVHEQWIYGAVYLYFKNGILTSFQD